MFLFFLFVSVDSCSLFCVVSLFCCVGGCVFWYISGVLVGGGCVFPICKA